MSFLFVDTFVMSEGALPEWGTFCEDQAQKLADCFKQELRQFRLSNPQFDSVPTAGFARLFTASFLTHFEEADASHTRETNAAAATSTTATSPPGRQKAWKSIFRKRDSKDNNERESSTTNSSSGAVGASEGKMRKRSNTMKASVGSSPTLRNSPFVEQPTVVMSSNMNMLQFNNQSSDNFDNLSWTRCHVSLCLTHGMYQLLIRSPPKVCALPVYLTVWVI